VKVRGDPRGGGGRFTRGWGASGSDESCCPVPTEDRYWLWIFEKSKCLLSKMEIEFTSSHVGESIS
jgi:hypothetical protein